MVGVYYVCTHVMSKEQVKFRFVSDMSGMSGVLRLTASGGQIKVCANNDIHVTQRVNKQII